MTTNILLALFVGILSGLVVDALLQWHQLTPYMDFYGAGLIFGIMTAPFFNYVVNSNRKILNICLWTLFSGLSYFAAVWTTTNIGPRGFFVAHSTTAYSYLIGGIVGALILIGPFHFLFGRLRTVPMAIVLIAGGLLPYILFNVLDLLGHAQGSLFVLLLYPLWQGAITTLLTYAVLKHQKLIAPGALAFDPL
jgi:hypothetical protein